MAAVAAHEADDVMPVKVLKGSRNKQLKPIKIEKSSTVKASGKAPSSKNPPDDPKPSGSPGIPLVCLVCTSTPRFSDLSHLLTHLSSKGHLQTQNDVRIRATQDLAAADKVATYDKWYKDYGIERMLAERLKAKDEKARGFSRSGQGTSQTLKRKKARSTLVKREANDSMFTPPPTGRLLGQQQAITYYGDNDDLASASTPTDDAIEWGPDDLESARLKGTVWPGMGIFDAATPDQKKQRNQRKDASVLRKMELSSQAITTLEIVANLDLEFERTRDVYDAPSVEGSPVIKKSRRRQRSSGAAEEDGNASGVVVKEELADEAAHRASSALAMQLQNGLYKQEEVSELDSESLSEKFDVTSDIASTADGDSDTLDYAGMIELDESHKEIGGPDRGPNDQFFTVTDRVSDVFQGGSAAGKSLYYIRLPAHPLTQIIGTKASTTVKDEPRSIPENSHHEHKMTSIDFYGVNNTHLNQAGMTTAINMDPNIFTGYSMPDMYHLNPVWGNPMLRAGHHGFNPINANHNHQQMMFSQQMPMMNTFGNGHHDHAQGSGVYQNGHGA
ncbi:hypothetical protein BDP67DRAFT_494755 [Colletotrichum lupini]|nr:hypothetical protein BDP67DRAFT_494755 [Colletotrichum lupini]